MRHTSLYERYRELEAIELEELKKAVMAHGGEFRWMTEDGDMIGDIDTPMIVATSRYWTSSCDCIVTRVSVVNDHVEIYGCDKERWVDEILLDMIEFGNIGLIIDCIPETDKVSNVSLLVN